MPACAVTGVVWDAVETFDPGTLWKRIDGRAEFYRASGFVGLRCARGRFGDGGGAIEACEYDMGSARNAFSVYSRQRRPALDDDLAYPTSDGWFAVGGRHYVEVSARTRDEGSPAIAAAYARCYRLSRPSGAPDLPEIRLLPSADLTRAAALSNGPTFGFDRLDSLLFASYRTAGGEAIGFVSVRADEADARGVADAFEAFLRGAGGMARGVADDVPGSRVIETPGGWDVVFHRGRTLAGVHEAPSRDDAERLAAAVAAAVGAGDP
jgi:hypothetical protein